MELKPLTLFYGYNNSGKSALLRGVSLILESLLSQINLMPPSIDSALLRGGDFESLVSGEKSSLEFSLSMPSGLRFECRIRNFSDFYIHAIESFELFDPDGKSQLHAILNLEKSELIDEKFIYDISELEAPHTERPVTFLGLTPFEYEVGNRKKDLTLIDAAWDLRSSARQPVVWLSSERGSMERQVAEKSGQHHISHNGKGIEQLLHRALSSGNPWVELLQSWLDTTFGLQIYSQVSSKNISIYVGRKNEPFRVNLLDAGQGIQEIIPIVSMLFSRAAGDSTPEFLSIEEPESHLHPRYHAALADAFCSAIDLNPDCVTLAETHSENLLLRVQIQIASGKISHDSVIVYWFRQIDGGSTVLEPIRFDEFGRPLGNWPQGVFSEDVTQARELIKIQNTKLG